MRVRESGPAALVAEVGSAAEAAALASWARTSGSDIEAVEIVPAARSVLFDGVVSPDRLRAALAGWSGAAERSPGTLVEVPVVYDGPDLAFVAERWGVTEAEVVARHTSWEFVSAFCGFAPGFAYLVGLPVGLSVPRLSTPRPRVENGAVGLAGEYCGVYPSASPGGWRLLGRTDLTLWDVTRDPPALLAPGTRVRFRDASSLGSPTQGVQGVRP